MIDSAFLRSRIARRVVMLFVSCALVPLALVTIFSLHQLNGLNDRRDGDELAAAARSYGMTLLGRLTGACTVFDTLATTATGSANALLVQQIERMDWARNVHIVAAAGGSAGRSTGLPLPDARQRAALQAGRTTLVWDVQAPGNGRLYLLRQLDADRWLYAELAPDWLWDHAEEYASQDGLVVLTADGQTLTAAGEAVAVLGDGFLRVDGASRPALQGSEVRPGGARSDDRWRMRAWEVFLGSNYASPSWYVVTVRERTSVVPKLGEARTLFPLIVLLTILLVSLLSVALIRRTLDPLARLIEGTQRLRSRDFCTRVKVVGDDEFAHLAHSFNGMADDLQAQFSALEALAGVDRLLLRSPGLEQILDSVLPRITTILDCRAVSVLLPDEYAPDHARLYEHYVNDAGARPVRRVTVDLEALRRRCEPARPMRIAAAQLEEDSFLVPLLQSGAAVFELWTLHRDEEFAGLLCLAFAERQDDASKPSISGEEFADRLSVALTNLSRTERLYHQANFDALTALPNRQVLRERLSERLRDATPGRDAGTVLYIDLDHFKHVNDTAGHTVGDELLRIVAQRLRTCVTDDTTVARLGGDEFAVLLPSVTDPPAVRRVADRLLAAIAQTVVIGRREYHVAASIGITTYPTDAHTVEELLKNGDIAMYRAKESGRARALFFEAEMREELRMRSAIESGLYRAFASDAFEVHYQPIVECGSRRAVGVEALLRWPEKSGSPSGAPSMFIPVAEQCGLIIGLGEWVLQTACRQYCAWRQEGLALDYVSVNASVRQIKEADFLQKVLGILASCDMPPHALQLEITESVLAEGSSLEHTLTELAARGIRLALDDFGTGYSSLSYLRTYPIDTVKIDQSFVADVVRNPASARLIESIIMMSTALQKQVVAEGVESESQLRFLETRGCGSVQGFLLGRPMSADEISSHLAWSAAPDGVGENPDPWTAARRKPTANAS